MRKNKSLSNTKPTTKTEPKLIQPDFTEVDRIYAIYRKYQMECFARFVIDEGYGATAPANVGSAAHPRYETWQECGRRMFGDPFVTVLQDELRKRRLAQLGVQDHTAPVGGDTHAAPLQRNQRISSGPEPGHETQRGQDARREDLRGDAKTS